MYPELIRIGDFSISSFGVMVAAAFLVAYWLASKEFNRKEMSEELLGNIFLAAMIGGIGGAKLFFLIENVPIGELLSNPFTYLFSRGGLTFYGGFLGALLLVYIVTYRHNEDIWKVGDALAPSLAIGYSIGRIGCLLVGDDYGIPSDLPWAMAFPEGLPPTTETVHPTQIYEALIMGMVFLYLWNFRTKVYRTGYLFSLYLILAGSERFMIEFLRVTTPSPVPGLSVAQLLAAAIITVGVIKILKLRR